MISRPDPTLTHFAGQSPSREGSPSFGAWMPWLASPWRNCIAPFLALALLTAPLPGAPVISEFMAANTSGLADQDGAYSDWIEIWNPDATAVNLAGYGLTDNAALPLKWTFPAISLAPNSYLVVFASGKNRSVAGAELHTNFSLSAGGEYLALAAPSGSVLDAFAPEFPSQDNNLTYGIGLRTQTQDRLASSTPQVLVPASGAALPAAWNTAGYSPDAFWITGTGSGGVGYDRAVAVPSLINVATIGAATQSSNLASYTANLAINGSNGDFTHTDGSAATPWWQVAWGADQTIYTVTLNNRSDCCQSRLRDVTVQILAADGVTVLFTSPLLNPENVLNGPAAITVDVASANGGVPVVGRIVKVTRTPDPDASGFGAVAGNSHDAYTLSLAEVTVLVPDPNNGTGQTGIRNIARNGTATQTSTLGSFTASLGIDGNTGNFTHTINTDHAAAWTLNLKSRALIYEITVNNRGDGCCQFRLRDITVEILDADATTVLWTSPLLNPENTDNNPQLLDIDVAGLAGGPVIGQYVRIKRTGDPDFSGQGGVAGSADDAWVLSLGEVDVQGEPITNYDPFIITDIESAAYNQIASAFVRWPFSLTGASDIATVKLLARYDDGFVAYLNGVKIAERNAPASPTWNSTATLNRDDALAYRPEEVDVTAFQSALVDGPNVLAIHMLNTAANDEDFLFQPQLITSNTPQLTRAFLVQPTPGAANNVDYYLDRVADTVFSVKRGIYTNPISVAITCATPDAVIHYTTDGSAPTADTGNVYTGPIAVSTTTILRAAAYKAEWQPANVDTQTYVFPSQLFGSPVMNQTIMTNPAYQTRLMPALTGLPMVSLVFSGDISRTERPTSMELIGFGDGDIQEDCGMAQYGSYVTNFAKRSVRLYFRQQYGATKLKYPIFRGFDHDLPATDEFDALDLRQGSHDMVERGYYLSNPYCDDSLLDMGHLNPHGRFIHVMVNGQYWGIYHLRERWNASMHSQYLGGQPENYEAIVSNRGGGPWSAGLPYDGTGAFWNTMLTKRSDWIGIQPYLDTNQFLDFMLLFMSGESEAEQRCVSPNSLGSGFKFYLNDADGWTRTPSDRTLNEGPDNIMAMLRTQGHPDYKMTLADRIQRHYFNGGAMTSAKMLARHDARAVELEIPFVLESARWGYRTVDSWTAARDSYRNSVLANLNSTMISRFRNYGLLPTTLAPVFSQHGGNVPSGYELTMSGTNGLVYYTTDNTDPRLPGGGISSTAQTYQSATSAETLLSTGAVWKFRDLGEDLGASDVVVGHASYSSANWKHPAYNDAAWSSGPAELGYGDSPVTTVSFGINSSAKYITTHFRRHFTVTGLSQITGLTMRIKRDDGAIVYLNGVEIARPNMAAGSVYGYNSPGPNGVSGTDEETLFTFPGLPLSSLMEGDNVIAVEVHQNAATSSDLSFDLELTATRTNTTTDQIFLTKNTVIKARALTGADWSGLVEAFFAVGGAPAVASADVTISEIHYNPATGLETEFVEVMNISDHAINLRGCQITEGFPCLLPANRDTILAPGQRTVLAKSLWDINTTYGLGRPVAALAPKSNLNNGGEVLTLADATGSPLRSLTFDNGLPWPTSPDGAGPSLTLAAPMANPYLDNPLAWRPSFVIGGTPGAQDGFTTTFSGDPAADADGNGFTDFEDYALGNDGVRPEVLPQGEWQTLMVNGIPDRYLTLTFRLNGAAADAVMEVESSEDLSTWSTGQMVLFSRTDAADGTVTVAFRSAVPVSDASIRRLFVRLAIRS